MADGKWVEGVSPEAPVADAARVVLAARFEVVRQAIPAAAGPIPDDPEHVHRLRVGTRRAAAALKVFAGCLRRKHRKAAANSLRAIRQAAGAARDCDVFLAALTAAADGPADERPAFDFLLGHTLAEREAAQTRLADVTADAGGWLLTKSAALPGRTRPPRDDDTPRTFGELAAVQLGRLVTRFDAAVAADPAEPRELHQLRIRAKRLRYAMEVFAGCFAPPLRQVLYPAVEAVQELLGRLQDAVVGAGRLDRLRGLAERVIPDEWPRVGTGIGRLIRDCREQVPAGRDRFREWREGWLFLTAAHPLGSLRVTAAG